MSEEKNLRPGLREVADTILLFGQTRIRFYYLGENEKMILLFSIGREYDFTKSGGTGVISSDAAFFCFTGPFQAHWVSAAPLQLREPG